MNTLTEEGQHEDSVIADSKLVGVAEVVSGRELVILAATPRKREQICSQASRIKFPLNRRDIHSAGNVAVNLTCGVTSTEAAAMVAALAFSASS